MKKTTMFAAPLIAVAMMTSVPMSLLAEKTAETPAAPSTAKADQSSKGYQDGMEAYKLDKLAGRPIGAKTSHLYVHPPVQDGYVREQYRAQFELGYAASMGQGN